jgi:hypothetical protein
MEVEVEGGKLKRFFPCLQSGPFDEGRRHRFARKGENGLDIVSYTSRRGAYRLNPNQSVILELAGTAETAVMLRLTRPVAQTLRTTLGELARTSRNEFTGPFPAEGFQWHRLTPLRATHVGGTCRVAFPGGRGHTYLRARQLNGHIAWSSPVFVGYD